MNTSPPITPKTYSNPQTSKTIENWPYGSLRTTAMFYVETNSKGEQRGVRRTVNPKNGTLSAPKKLTFARQVRIVDGSDSRTYVIELVRNFDFISVKQSNMQFDEENIFDNDPRFAAIRALFDQVETANATPKMEALTV